MKKIVLVCMAVLCLSACKNSKKQTQEQTTEKIKVMEQVFCQSCGMPLTVTEHFGTNADGSKSADYCVYCYKDGVFLQDLTMDEMIEHCAQFVEEFNKDSEQKVTREEAIAQMKEFFPQLKRWKKQ